MVTSPMITAPGAIHADRWIRGVLPLHGKIRGTWLRGFASMPTILPKNASPRGRTVFSGAGGVRERVPRSGPVLDDGPRAPVRRAIRPFGVDGDWPTPPRFPR